LTIEDVPHTSQRTGKPSSVDVAENMIALTQSDNVYYPTDVIMATITENG
jgi:hypothetical protein